MKPLRRACCARHGAGVTTIRLGTRASPLALAQAHEVRRALEALGRVVEVLPVTTEGDRVLDRPLVEIGGKALWTKELDAALLDRRIDIAVHSMKDVETSLAPGIAIAAILPREDVADRLIGADSIAALPTGARVGTSSPRRAAQLRHARPDLRVVGLRGNVQTRLARLENGAADATLLAAAGLRRLGMDLGAALPVDGWLPAPAQGAIGVTTRVGEEALVAALDHGASATAVHVERALLAALGGTCRTPIAALALVDGGALWLRGEIYAEDGSECVRGERRGPIVAAPVAAADLARELLAGATPALAAAFGHAPSPSLSLPS